MRDRKPGGAPCLVFLLFVSNFSRRGGDRKIGESRLDIPLLIGRFGLRMAEEQRCQEGHRLCANNCGFFGSPATFNLCSKCYRDLRLKEDQAASAKVAVERSLSPPPSSSAPAPSLSSPSAASSFPLGEPSGTAAAAAVDTARRPIRCLSCRKKVGLMGFLCRCEKTFCGEHRYPERHSCAFDYKATGRESIARANPLVKADKLRKI